jgi:hypothetical protein
MIRQLEDELREYDELKSGDLPLPNVERLDRSPPLSRRCVFSGECLNLNLRAGLGFSKQVISPPKTTTAVRAGATRASESRLFEATGGLQADRSVFPIAADSEHLAA